MEGERWTGEGGKGTGDGKNAGRCPPASCRRPPASFRCRTPRKHRCSTRFRILKGSEGTTLRCAVSNVERMRQAFDFYVESTRWQVVGMQCLAARSAAVTFYIFWGTCSILPPRSVRQTARCVQSNALFEGGHSVTTARRFCNHVRAAIRTGRRRAQSGVHGVAHECSLVVLDSDQLSAVGRNALPGRCIRSRKLIAER